MKKAISILLLVVVLTSLLSLTAYADTDPGTGIMPGDKMPDFDGEQFFESNNE